MKDKQLLGLYQGENANHYDERRRTAKWEREQAAVKKLLESISRESKLLDVPVGTGRFLDAYKTLGISVTGVDLSDDMLSLAAERATEIETKVNLLSGDITNLDFDDNSFDCIVCMRFLNLFDWDFAQHSLEELTRVTGRYIITGIRHYVPWTELGLPRPSGFKKLVKQMNLRNSARHGGKIHPHCYGVLCKTFSVNGLRITDVLCVDQNRYDGTTYNVYLLEKVN